MGCNCGKATAVGELGGFGEPPALAMGALMVGVTVLYNVPGLVVGGIAAAKGYPKLAAGAVVANSAIAAGVEYARVKQDDPRAQMATGGLWITGITGLTLATILFLVGRSREKKLAAA